MENRGPGRSTCRRAYGAPAFRRWPLRSCLSCWQVSGASELPASPGTGTGHAGMLPMAGGGSSLIPSVTLPAALGPYPERRSPALAAAASCEVSKRSACAEAPGQIAK